MGSEHLEHTVTNQRRAVILAGVLAFAGIWIAIGAGEWLFGVFAAIGVALGLLNLVLTEYSLRTSVHAGQPNKRRFASLSLLRLMGISLVALTLAAVFWPAGASVLLGLAVFHLFTLVLSGIPLLKELRKA